MQGASILPIRRYMNLHLLLRPEHFRTFQNIWGTCIKKNYVQFLKVISQYNWEISLEFTHTLKFSIFIKN